MANPIPSWASPDTASAALPAARPATGPVVDFAALVRRREAGEHGAALVLVPCALPLGTLEPTFVSALVPPPPAGIARWEAFWTDDEGYLLHAVRTAGSAGDATGDTSARESDASLAASSSEWFTLALAEGTRPTVRANALTRALTDPHGHARLAPAPDRARLHMVLVGWRPLGGGASRWSVASRRA